jgi:hypothetical protein
VIIQKKVDGPASVGLLLATPYVVKANKRNFVKFNILCVNERHIKSASHKLLVSQEQGIVSQVMALHAAHFTISGMTGVIQHLAHLHLDKTRKMCYEADTGTVHPS